MIDFTFFIHWCSQRWLSITKWEEQEERARLNRSQHDSEVNPTSSPLVQGSVIQSQDQDSGARDDSSFSLGTEGSTYKVGRFLYSSCSCWSCSWACLIFCKYLQFIYHINCHLYLTSFYFFCYCQGCWGFCPVGCHLEAITFPSHHKHAVDVASRLILLDVGSRPQCLSLLMWASICPICCGCDNAKVCCCVCGYAGVRWCVRWHWASVGCFFFFGIGSSIV